MATTDIKQKINRFNNLLVGSHISNKSPDYLLGASLEIIRQNATCGMVFLGPPRNTSLCDFSSLKVDEAKEVLRLNNLDIPNICVHFPYIINPSSQIEEHRKLAYEFFDKELSLMEKIGLNLCCFHPGSSKGQDRLTCMKDVAKMFYPLFKEHNSIKIAIETMAGKGDEVNVGLKESRIFLDDFLGLNNVGICLDTCHLWDSGLDICNFDILRNEINETIGFEKVFLIHLNDSKNPRGYSKDRHENLGKGFIGYKALSRICYAREFKNVFKILETPLVNGDEHKDEIQRLKSCFTGEYIN